MMNQFQPNQQMYQQYANAANTNDYSQINPQEAAQLLHQFIQNAPPDVQRQAFQQAFSQMPQQQAQMFGQHLPGQYGNNYQNPQQMAQDFHQVAQQQPDMLHQILGQGGALSNPMAKMAVAGLAAVAAKHFLGGGFNL